MGVTSTSQDYPDYRPSWRPTPRARPFAGGTILGLADFASVDVSYFFGFTKFLNHHEQGIPILASSITDTVLCTLGGLLYTLDASRMKRGLAAPLHLLVAGHPARWEREAGRRV